MNVNVELSDEATDNLIVEVLKSDVESDNPWLPGEVKEAMHKVIAWYSVTGTYEGGKYDVEID